MAVSTLRHPSRLMLTVAALVATLLVAGACGGNKAGPTPSGSASAAQGIGAKPTSAAAPATKPPPTPIGTTYAKTARAYAEAVLGAWKDGEVDVLGELTTPQVQEQIMEIPGHPNQNWTYSTCEGAAGSSYCLFWNAAGDEITLRISNQLLGQAHATTEVRFDATSYPDNPVEYVKAFIAAWGTANRARMTLLSSAEITDYVTHFTPPGPYSTCTEGTAGSTYVRVYNADGLDYTFRVTTQSLGGPHAIAERSTVAASCP